MALRILAVNGSPHGAKGNTERILQPFLEGAGEAGAETEVIYLRDRDIRFTDSPDDELAGVICCAGGALLQSPALQQHTAWYLEAAKQAGREVVEQGRISAETQAVLDRPLVEDPAVCVSIVNSFWESQGVGMIEFDDGGRAAALSSEAVAHGTRLPPSTGSDAMRDLVAGMAAALNPEAAGDLEAVI